VSEKPEAFQVAKQLTLRAIEELTEENVRLRLKNGRLRELLLRIRAWDYLDGAADGLFWKREIEQVLQEVPR
jgi:regulator of replication initiation timing